MTSVRVDGQDNRPPPVQVSRQASPMYSIPLNSTSAINVHLLFQQQQQQQQQLLQQQQNGMPMSSASTYVHSTPRATQGPISPPVPSPVPHPPDAHAVAVNTENMFNIPPVAGYAGRSSSTIGVNTDGDLPVIEPQKRVMLVSVDSEPDSTRGSIPDDTGSVHSYGSRGTSESISEDISKKLAPLKLNITNDDGIGTSPPAYMGDQREFTLGRVQSMGSSIGSQGSSLGSPNSPASPQSARKSSITSPTSPASFQIERPTPGRKNWQLTWDDSDEVASNASWNTKFTDASSFILDDFTDEESREAEDADALKATRVAVLKGDEMTCMIKVKCSAEEMGFDLRVLLLLQDILIRCDQLGKKMKGSAVRLTPFHLNKMKMQDGRPAKERAAEVARILEGDFILCEAVCQRHSERLHICTELKDKVYEKGTFSVGKLGIMVTLWKKHKYAVAREFSEPLCSHIHFYRPHLLGSTSDSTSKRKRKATDTVRRILQAPALLGQMFKTDPTITVAEAARRSFVEIIFYALYE